MSTSINLSADSQPHALCSVTDGKCENYILCTGIHLHTLGESLGLSNRQ